MKTPTPTKPHLPAALIAALLAACGEGEPTWHQDVAPVVAERCGGCHKADGIGAFPLTTYDEVVAMAGPVRYSIEAGTMPPWQGADDCNEYSNDSSLSDDEEATLLAWLDGGTPEGDPEDAAPIDEDAPMEADLSLQLPEPYAPTQEPDDYRCQLIEWPLDEAAWITGLSVTPDQEPIVHHAIVFATDAEGAQAFYDMDAAEDGPGYTCFGGPTAGSEEPQEDRSGWTAEQIQEAFESGELDVGLSGARWLGAWVPGSLGLRTPEGSGLRMEPGDLLIVQMHYNTQSADPVADQSSIALQIADAVEREAMMMPMTDIGWVTGIDLLGGAMDIPAGEADVAHATTIQFGGMYFDGVRDYLGLGDDSALAIHTVGHHMHLLGETGYQAIERADGSETCLVDVPEWDFGWQGGFNLAEPVIAQPEDALYLECSWDNSAANQPEVDGGFQESQDVAWGEGSTDEMCLSTLLLTAP